VAEANSRVALDKDYRLKKPLKMTTMMPLMMS